jgi:hypothetical protein
MTDCHLCKRTIRFLPSQEEHKLAEYTDHPDGTRTKRYIVLSTCMWCVVLKSLFSWLKANAVYLLAVPVILGAVNLLYAHSREARSQETSAVYQNPDFPCVRAINPTVTDLACVAAIARRH